MTLISKVILVDTNGLGNLNNLMLIITIIFKINMVTTATNYYHEFESSVAEYFKVRFVRSPLSSKVIKVVPIVLKVVRMSTMY